MSSPEQPQANQDNQQSQDKAESNDFASNFANIIKQEKHNTEIRKKLEEERRKIEQDRKDLEAFKSVTSNAINQVPHSQPEVKDAFRAIEQLKAELREKQEEDLNRKYADKEKQLDEQIAHTVKNKEFDIIEKLGLYTDVKNKLFELHKKSGTTPTIEEACELVADEISEKYSRIKDSKFLKPREARSEASRASEPASTGIKSVLTNKMVQNPSISKPKTDDERLKAADAWLKASKGAIK